MDEKPDQILNHIEAQRSELGANLSELETRVRRTTDWRTHFDNNPMLMMGVALGGGVLLGAMVGGSSSRQSSGKYRSTYSSSGRSNLSGAQSFSSPSSSSPSSSSYSSSSQSSPAVSYQRQRASETIDHIKAALIGFATARAKEFLNQALPGFDHHLQEVESQGGSSSSRSNVRSGSESSYFSEGGSGYTPGGYSSQSSGSGGQGANYGSSDYASHSGTPNTTPST